MRSKRVIRMSWAEHHKASEKAAVEAYLEFRAGNHMEAARLYLRAAELEEQALADLDPLKTRTIRITTTSAAALWHKASVAAKIAMKELLK